jgi:hypothetical protein
MPGSSWSVFNVWPTSYARSDAAPMIVQAAASPTLIGSPAVPGASTAAVNELTWFPSGR